MKRTAPSKLIGYCRVSTEEQAREGVSLDAQQERIKQYASLYNYKLVDIFTDAGASGKSLEREGLQQALAALSNKEADGLLVAKLDRLTRRVYDLASLIQRYFTDDKAHLLSVSEQLDTHSAGGRLLVHILASVAEWERETIAERIREALSHLKQNGVVLGAEGLGWERTEELDAEGRHVVRPIRSEQEAVERILQLRGEGNSLRKIADRLTEEGWSTKRGGRWQAQTIASVLRRQRA